MSNCWLPTTKIEHRQVRQPRRQQRVDMQLPRGASGLNPKIACNKAKTEPAAQACGKLAPRYWTELVCIALNGRIELGQLVRQEISPRSTDIARDPCRLGAEAIAFKPERNDRVVVRPDRASR